MSLKIETTTQDAISRSLMLMHQ